MISVTGIIEEIIFHNEENGYTVFSLRTEGEELVCTGVVQDLRPGETAEVTGDYVEHPSYGRQFRADRCEIRMPEGADAIRRYLASGVIRGIGAALAGRIVDAFGDDTLRVLEEEPESLAIVKGISMRKAQEISAQIASQQDMRDAVIFLSEYSIPLSVGLRIYRAYGQEMYGILRENPYRLADEIEGIGFRTADEIARRVGFQADAAFRVRSAVLYVLQEAAGEGSVYLPRDLLSERTAGLLSLEVPAVETEIDNLAVERRVILRKREDGTMAVYHERFYFLEMETARMLLDLSAVVDADRETIERTVRKLSEEPVRLEEEQVSAVTAAASYGLTIVTGGPGTGKTTVVSTILRYFENRGLSIALAAPTGRAAKRMTETTGREASTIHRLLEIGPAGGEGERMRFRFGRNEETPLEEDVVIIDEMSMVDISLMHSLLCAVAPGTHLVLVGDANQLPSVGPGNVLRDLISSDAFPVVRLTRIFRQAAESDIVVNAHKINAGQEIALDNKSKDFFFLRRDEADRIISNMLELIRGKLPRYVNAEPEMLQVLTPMRKGPLGTIRLNQIMQRELNPPSPRKRETEYGDMLLREGDKVMQTRNDYQMHWEVPGRYGIPVLEGEGVFNGDIGVVEEIDPVSRTVTVRFDEGRRAEYLPEQLPELELSYAVTIHKSQGSEYPAVLIPLLSGPAPLMTRNLLYTAVTRARKCVVLLGREETVREMIASTPVRTRYTSLDTAVRKLLETTV